jgi:AcrR family transcriptional regulator
VPVEEHVGAIVLQDLDGALGERRDQAEEEPRRGTEERRTQRPGPRQPGGQQSGGDPDPHGAGDAGRRPGASETQEQIRQAAAKLFVERGYQGATMRAIAKDAGVDASLIVHFFGNKLNLFAESVEWPFDPEVEMPKILADGRRNVGRNLVRLLIRIWDKEGTRSPILTLLAAATVEPEAAEMLAGFVRERLFAPLLDELGSDHPEMRADLLSSQLMGLGITRYVLRAEPLASAKSADVIRWVGPNVQRYLTLKLD